MIDPFTGKKILNIRAISEFGKALLPSEREMETRQRGKVGQSLLHLHNMLVRDTFPAPGYWNIHFVMRRGHAWGDGSQVVRSGQAVAGKVEP